MWIDVYRVRLTAPPLPGCADAAVHAILTAALGRAPAIVRGEHGKPELADGALAFNVAHSGELALVAVAPRGPLGVDLEQHRPLRDSGAFARRFFSPAEAARVAAEPAELYRLWCRKEAWLKAQGSGLRLPLSTVDVSAAPPGWALVDLAIAPGYAAALACAGAADAPIRIRDYRAGDPAP